MFSVAFGVLFDEVGVEFIHEKLDFSGSFVGLGVVRMHGLGCGSATDRPTCAREHAAALAGGGAKEVYGARGVRGAFVCGRA